MEKASAFPLISEAAEWRHFIKLRQTHFLRRALGKNGLASAQAMRRHGGHGLVGHGPIRWGENGAEIFLENTMD